MNFAKQKRSIVEMFLPLCPFLSVDGANLGCELPADLRVPMLILRIGLDANVLNMPGLKFTDRVWSGTISQQGQLSNIVIPWVAVNGIRIGPPFEGPIVLWPEDTQPPADVKPRPKLGLVPQWAGSEDFGGSDFDDFEPPRSA